MLQELFTGWSANAKGEFIFRKFQHDTDTKTVLGKTGNLGGEDVLDHLLDQKQTALFITRKVYRFFVNDNIDNKKVEWLADRFYKSNYHIAALFQKLLKTSERRRMLLQAIQPGGILYVLLPFC